MMNNVCKIWMEMAIAYLQVLSQQRSRETKENHEKPVNGNLPKTWIGYLLNASPELLLQLPTK